MKKLSIAFFLLFASLAYGQNDFAYYPIGMPVFAALPTDCPRVGFLVWLTTAPAGQNIWGSTTAGSPCTWTQMTGIAGPAGPQGAAGSGSGNVNASGTLTSTRIATGAGTTNIQTPSASATVDASGNLIAASVKTAAGNPVPFGPTTAIVGNVALWNSTTGLSVSDGGFVPVPNTRTVTAIAPLTGGGSLNANQTIACPTCSTTIGSGTLALHTTAIASGGCDLNTVTVTGALATDAPIASFNGDVTGVTGYVPLTTGTLSLYTFPGANSFNVKVCNNTSSTITPGAASVNYRFVR